MPKDPASNSAGCFAAYRAVDDDQLARILAVLRDGLIHRPEPAQA